MNLFEPFHLGPLLLTNRIVMAPMTRSRAVGNLANDLHRLYYAQRASAGLIITEGIAPSANALGYARIPALFNEEQAASWRPVTEAVHQSGGRIIAQLMHVGRIGHPLNLPHGARLVAPSAVAASGQIHTDASGLQPFPQPEEMSRADVRAAIGEFEQAAALAREAGFDGVELHGANGYLIEQFINPHINRRTDAYGGSVEARSRFALEALDAAASAIGRERVAIRLSPYNTFNDAPLYDEIHEQYLYLARHLTGLLYVHLVQNRHPEYRRLEDAMRAVTEAPVVLNGGFDRERAQAALDEGRTDLISFGRPFIANPDLVHRFQSNLDLATPDPTTFYTPGEHGFVDYEPARMAG